MHCRIPPLVEARHTATCFWWLCCRCGFLPDMLCLACVCLESSDCRRILDIGSVFACTAVVAKTRFYSAELENFRVVLLVYCIDTGYIQSLCIYLCRCILHLDKRSWGSVAALLAPGMFTRPAQSTGLRNDGMTGALSALRSRHSRKSQNDAMSIRIQIPSFP